VILKLLGGAKETLVSVHLRAVPKPLDNQEKSTFFRACGKGAAVILTTAFLGSIIQNILWTGKKTILGL